jgi:hypothetical protein
MEESKTLFFSSKFPSARERIPSKFIDNLRQAPPSTFTNPNPVSKVRMGGCVFPFFHTLALRAHKHLCLYCILMFAVQHKNLGNWRGQTK